MDLEAWHDFDVITGGSAAALVRSVEGDQDQPS
jgi:hypothetical protein